MKALLIALLLLCNVLPAVARAQQTPEAVVRACSEAINARGLTAMPEFIHPDELQRFKAMFQPLLTDDTSGGDETLLRVFFGNDASLESVAGLSPASVMARVMKVAESQLGGARMQVEEQRFPGAVHEGALIHLVTRNTVRVGATRSIRMEVASLKPHGDSWRMLLSGDVEAMGNAIRAGVAPGAIERS